MYVSPNNTTHCNWRPGREFQEAVSQVKAGDNKEFITLNKAVGLNWSLVNTGSRGAGGLNKLSLSAALYNFTQIWRG